MMSRGSRPVSAKQRIIPSDFHWDVDAGAALLREVHRVVHGTAQPQSLLLYRHSFLIPMHAIQE